MYDGLLSTFCSEGSLCRHPAQLCEEPKGASAYCNALEGLLLLTCLGLRLRCCWPLSNNMPR